MKHLSIATLAVFTITGATTAIAGPSCNVDKAEWQPEQALRDKLTAEKWSIKAVKIDNGCYEVYGKDGRGNRVETYFDPKTLEPVPGQGS